MADYYGTTVSEGGKLKDGAKEAVEAIISKYYIASGCEGDIVVRVNEDNEIEIFGAGTLDVRAKIADSDDRDDDSDELTSDMLDEIAPYLAENLIVSEVGNEKCRYVAAFAYVVQPNKKAVSVCLEDAILAALNKKD